MKWEPNLVEYLQWQSLLDNYLTLVYYLSSNRESNNDLLLALIKTQMALKNDEYVEQRQVLDEASQGTRVLNIYIQVITYLITQISASIEQTCLGSCLTSSSNY